MKTGPGTGPGPCRAYYFEVEIQLGGSVAEVVLVPTDSVVTKNRVRVVVNVTDR